MKLVLVSGSHRAHSNSRKVADYLAQRALLQGFAEACVLDIHDMALPLWDEEFRHQGPAWECWQIPSSHLQAADGLVLVTPEWAGMVPPGLKNLLLLCGPKELGNKPALLVSVSSGMGGSYPIAELRMSGYKNNHLCYLPDHLIVRRADEFLSHPEAIDEHEAALRARCDYSLRLLVEYARALRLVRESGVPDYSRYRFGM